MKWFRGHADVSEARETTQGGATGSSALRIWDSSLSTIDYFVVDIETSGFSADTDLILSLAAGCVTGLDSDFSYFIYELIHHDHLQAVPQRVWDVTGLTPTAFQDGKALASVLREVLELSVNRVWVAHHARHEMSFLQRHARLLYKLKLRPIVIDTAVVAQALGRLSRVPTLDEVCRWLEVDLQNRHQADADVRMTAEVWRKEMLLCQQIGLNTVSDVIDWTSSRAMG